MQTATCNNKQVAHFLVISANLLDMFYVKHIDTDFFASYGAIHNDD